eukprot:17744_1
MIKKEGFLEKQSLHLKVWRKRWVVFTEICNNGNRYYRLSTYKKERIYKNPTQEIYIYDNTQIAKFNKMEFSVEYKKYYQLFFFRANCEQSRNDWVNSIKNRNNIETVFVRIQKFEADTKTKVKTGNFKPQNPQNIEQKSIEIKSSQNKTHSVNYNVINNPLKNKNKILLIGASNCGKTSIKSILFARYLAKDCACLEPTIKISVSSIQLFGNDLTLNIWDCGGAAKFMEAYFGGGSPVVFSNISILVYVFDISRENDCQLQYEYFNNAINCLKHFSSNAEIHCFFHKMDTIDIKDKKSTLNKHNNKLNNIAKIFDANVKYYFTTSIWDDTLHRWCSQMIRSFIFNPLTESTFKQKLTILCHKSLIDDIALLECNTYAPFIQTNRF